MAKGSAGRSATVVRRARPSDAERLADLHVTTWQQAYAGLMPADYLRSLSASQRTRRWYVKRGWQLDGRQKAAELWGAQITEVRYERKLATGGVGDRPPQPAR